MSDPKSFDFESDLKELEHAGPSWTDPIARFRNTKGDIVGTGVLTVGNLVFTCAHVISGALGLGASNDTSPGDATELLIDFPSADVYDVTVKVVGWYPPVPDDKRRRDSPPTDLAVLETTKPDQIAGLTPFSISNRNPQPDTSFICHGFPRGSNGETAEGVLLGTDAGGWILAMGRPSFAGPGFSGAPVFARVRRETGKE
jgi:hypothetical protein